MAKAKKNMSNTSLITKQFYNIARGNVSHTKLQKLQHHRNDSYKKILGYLCQNNMDKFLHQDWTIQ